MHKIVKRDILAIISEAIDVLQKEDKSELREVSDHTIHCASIFQDEDSISFAVLMYAIFKIIDRDPSVDCRLIISVLNKIKHFLSKNDIDNYRKQTKLLFETITRLDDKIKLYIQKVLVKAKIKKGSRLIEHGLSVGRVAELMNISQWELMKYLGKTGISDRDRNIGNVRLRLKFARGLFE